MPWKTDNGFFPYIPYAKSKSKTETSIDFWFIIANKTDYNNAILNFYYFFQICEKEYLLQPLESNYLAS